MAVADSLNLRVLALRNQFAKASSLAYTNPSPENFAAAAQAQQQISELQKSRFGINSNLSASNTTAAANYNASIPTARTTAAAAISASDQMYDGQKGTWQQIIDTANYGLQHGDQYSEKAMDADNKAIKSASDEIDKINNAKKAASDAITTGMNTTIANATASAAAATKAAGEYTAIAKNANTGYKQAESTEGFLSAGSKKLQSDIDVSGQLAAQNLSKQQSDAAAAANYQAAAGGQQVSGSPAFDIGAAKKASTASAGAAPSGAPTNQPQTVGKPALAANLPTNSKTVFNAPSLTGFKFGGG